MRIEEVEDPGRGAGRPQVTATFDREQFYVVAVGTPAVTRSDDVARDTRLGRWCGALPILRELATPPEDHTPDTPATLATKSQSSGGA